METGKMSKAVDKFINDLEENWGAKPKAGNVSPTVKVTPTGDGGVTYTADPVKAPIDTLMDALDEMAEEPTPTPMYDLDAMNAELDEGEPTYEEEYAAAHGITLDADDITEEETKMTKATVPKGTFDVSKLMSAPTVTMLQATKLYQPVRGTSSGSRYFIIALSPALKVAARWKQAPASEGLALRVEGKGLTNPYTVKLLEQIGLDKKSEVHMSAHLTVTNDIEARKAIGALLYAINEPWTTPRPDPEVICV